MKKMKKHLKTIGLLYSWRKDVGVRAPPVRKVY